MTQKPYSDGISFTGVDGVMQFYHRTSVILMADSHGIRNLSKTIRSGRGNSIYAPPSPACRHVRFMLLPECKCSSSFCNSKNAWGGLDKTSDALSDWQEAWLCRTAVCDMNSLSEREEA